MPVSTESFQAVFSGDYSLLRLCLEEDLWNQMA